MYDPKIDIPRAKEQIEKREKHLEAVLGCIVGGAVGDALGYPVEFMSEKAIKEKYGPKGITEYELDRKTGKALISDDTQMSMFTAVGVMVGDTRSSMRGVGSSPCINAGQAYMDWLKTQNSTYEEMKDHPRGYGNGCISWLCDVPELYSRRAPGNTCLSQLNAYAHGVHYSSDFIAEHVNDSKGCGGIMRVAPFAVYYEPDREMIAMEGAQIAAVTHGHPLGYMPAAVLTHIINTIIYHRENKSLKDIVTEAMEVCSKLFRGTRHLDELVELVNAAVVLAENDKPDSANIKLLGEGWVAEETLAIAIYCALRYQDDFTAGVVAAVNHNGDSDSTGAVTGNILGAWLGGSGIDDYWVENLELKDVIMELGVDLCHGCIMEEGSCYEDPDWIRKYIRMRWKTEDDVDTKLSGFPDLHRMNMALREENTERRILNSYEEWIEVADESDKELIRKIEVAHSNAFEGISEGMSEEEAEKLERKLSKKYEARGIYVLPQTF